MQHLPLSFGSNGIKPRRFRQRAVKLVMAAAKTWRKLKGENQLPKVIQGVTFKDGVEVINTPAQNAA